MADLVKFNTPVFRASFPSLMTPTSYQGGAPKYNVSAVWTPAKFTEAEKKRWQEILTAINAECISRFKKPMKELKRLNGEGAGYKLVPRDGSTKSLEGYGPGTVFANLTTHMRPGIIDRANNKIGPEFGNADEIYAGVFLRASITIYSYDNRGKGVAMGLMNIQKVRDGDRLDGRTDADADFNDDPLENIDEESLVDDDIPF